jgi:hypothetical protein
MNDITILPLRNWRRAAHLSDFSLADLQRRPAVGTAAAA